MIKILYRCGGEIINEYHSEDSIKFYDIHNKEVPEKDIHRIAVDLKSNNKHIYTIEKDSNQYRCEYRVNLGNTVSVTLVTYSDADIFAIEENKDYLSLIQRKFNPYRETISQ